MAKSRTQLEQDNRELQEHVRLLEQSLQTEKLNKIELLKKIIDCVPLGIIVVENPDCCVTMLNSEAARLMGQAADSLLYQPLTAQAEIFKMFFTISGEPVSFDMFPLTKTLESGDSSEEVELLLKRTDEIEAIVLCRAVPLLGEEGKPTGVVLTFLDVTAKRQVEDERERLVDILEATSDIVSTATADAQITYINRAGRKMMGIKGALPRDDLYVKNLHPAWAYDIISSVGLPEAIAQGSWQGETALLNKDGGAVPVSQVIMAHTSDKGVVQYFSTIIRDISARKEVEQALREEQFFIDNALDALPGVFYLLGTDSRFYRWNNNMERVLGYSHDEIAALTAGDLFGDSEREKIFVAIKKVFEQGIVTVEASFLTKSGVEIPYFFSGARITIKGKLYLVGMGVDISVRKLAEQTLLTSEQNYRQLFDSSSDAIFIHDAETGAVLDVNKRMLEMWGCTLEDVVGLSLLDMSNSSAPYSKEDALQWIERTVKQGSQTFKWQSTKKNGELFWTEVRLQFVQLSGGRRVMAIVRDISEQVAAEEEMKNLRLYLQNVIDSMPSVLIGTDLNGIITFWNLEAERQTGVDAKSAHGKVLDAVFPFFRGKMKSILDAVVNGEPQRIGRQSQKIEEKNVLYDITVYPLRIEQIEGIVVRLDDVTARVKLEEMVVQTEKMLSVGGLAAGMAHELNNPLAGVLQNIQVLLGRVGSDLPASRKVAQKYGITLEAIKSFNEERGVFSMLEAILSSGRRAVKIVDNMLTFCHKSDANFESCTLSDLLDRAVELAMTEYDLKKRYDFKQIKIVREYDSGFPPVPCESSKMQQVFLNILKNGAQAMFEEGVAEPCFILRAKLYSSMAQIEIEDNGPGMSEEVRKRVFEPFFTTKQVGRGTGLGLSVSYFIVIENHGGEMLVESKPGVGANFIIRLPLKR